MQSEGVMITQTIEKTQLDSAEVYKLIKDEKLTSIIISCQILAGSSVQRSTYRHVVFSDCTFYSCNFQGVTFDNCIFENCNFKFSHLSNCKFNNCNFTDCEWMASSSTISVYDGSDLDSSLLEMIHFGVGNVVKNQNLRDHTTDIYIQLRAA